MHMLMLVAAFVAVVVASDPPAAYKAEEYKVEESYDGYSKVLYRGMYSDADKCAKDGFYYKSEFSFMMCSNGNSYEQRCAPGSRNSGYKNYKNGDAYYLHDFCDENLVDYTLPKTIPKGYNEVPKPVDGYEVKPVVVKKPAYVKPAVLPYGHASFHGFYHGKCSVDGFYFNNDDSFVICSNGVGYVQRCAPGTRNSGYGQYNKGNQYKSRDFCDVNLVDYGYGAYSGKSVYPGKSGYYQPAFVGPRGYGIY